MIGVRLCLNDDVLREAKGYHVCASTMRPVKGEDSGRQLGPVDWVTGHLVGRARDRAGARISRNDQRLSAEAGDPLYRSILA
jgi:hypothetical protein